MGYGWIVNRTIACVVNILDVKQLLGKVAPLTLEDVRANYNIARKQHVEHATANFTVHDARHLD